jgi:hypothetical protein
LLVDTAAATAGAGFAGWATLGLAGFVGNGRAAVEAVLAVAGGVASAS